MQHSVETMAIYTAHDEMAGPIQHQVCVHLEPDSYLALEDFWIKPIILRLCKTQVKHSLAKILVVKELCLPPVPQLWENEIIISKIVLVNRTYKVPWLRERPSPHWCELMFWLASSMGLCEGPWDSGTQGISA